MLIAVLFILAQNWKQPKYPSIGEELNKQWCLCTREYHSTTKKSDLLIHTTTWMDPKGIMLNKKIVITNDHVLHDSLYMT